MKRFELIRDRASISNALISVFCERCTNWDLDERYCVHNEEMFEDETDRCLINMVLGNLDDWDWPDSEDRLIVGLRRPKCADGSVNQTRRRTMNKDLLREAWLNAKDLDDGIKESVKGLKRLAENDTTGIIKSFLEMNETYAEASEKTLYYLDQLITTSKEIEK